jgi:hypothetical protein
MGHWLGRGGIAACGDARDGGALLLPAISSRSIVRSIDRFFVIIIASQPGKMDTA